MTEVVRNALVDGQGGNALASVSPTIKDPTKFALQVSIPDGVSVNVGDIEIGAVEIKDAITDVRTSVITRGSVGAQTVQIVDASGNQITTFGTPTTNYALENTGNLSVINTNTAPLVVSSAGGYIRQDSNNTIAKEAGGNLATIAGKDFATETTLALIKNTDGIKKITDAVTVQQSTSSNLKGQVEGLVASGATDSGNPIKIGGKYNATLPTVTDGQRVDGQFDSRGRLITSGTATGVSGSLTNAEFQSPYDFTATYTSNVTITITNASFLVDDTVCTITDLRYRPTGGSRTALTNTGSGVSITASSNVITVAGAGTPFASGDTYKIGIDMQRKAFDQTTDTTKINNQNPDPSYYTQREGVDTTNVTAATTYYPSPLGVAMDGYKSMSLTGKFIDADNKIVMTVEATNDEDQTNADWVQVYGFNRNTNFDENYRVASNGTLTFALNFKDFNFQFFRVKVINLDNTNTCIIKIRQIY